MKPLFARAVAALAACAALAAGARAAFVARPGMVPSPHGAQPEAIAADLGALAEELLA